MKIWLVSYKNLQAYIPNGLFFYENSIASQIKPKPLMEFRKEFQIQLSCCTFWYWACWDPYTTNCFQGFSEMLVYNSCKKLFFNARYSHLDTLIMSHPVWYIIEEFFPLLTANSMLWCKRIQFPHGSKVHALNTLWWWWSWKKRF